SRRSWVKGKEFEEDFLFTELLMQRFFLNPAVDAESLLERWQEALAGSEDARLPVVRALVGKDSQAFNTALARYLEVRAASIDARAEREDVPGDQLATESHFCVEGVALTRLARDAGLAIARAYRHVPAIALEKATENWASSAWESIGPRTDE